MTDQQMLAMGNPGAREVMVAIPLSMLLVAAFRAAVRAFFVKLGVAK